jgi:hypothetical protein
MNKPFPQIVSIGPPPERHAERVVDEMLDFMRKLQPQLRDRGHHILDLNRMGGKRGQERCVQRFLVSIAPLVLGWHLQTGKRGRFEFQFTTWAAWDPNKNEMLQASGPLPPGACLLAHAAILTGANYTPKWVGAPLLMISRHACIRLAMRSSVRTIRDLIEAMRELWDVFHKPMETGQESVNLWHIPFFFRKDSLVAVVTRHRSDERRFVVKTILDVNMCASLELLPTTQEKSIFT